MIPNSIVRFRKPNPSQASQFCFERELTGRIIRKEGQCFVIDFGLSYLVYSQPKYLDVIAKPDEFPALNSVE